MTRDGLHPFMLNGPGLARPMEEWRCTWDVGGPVCGLPYPSYNEHFHQQPARKLSNRRTISYRLRFAVFKRDHFRCQFCGASPADNPRVELEIDHKLPVAKGGTNNFVNLWTLCRPCNQAKGVLVLPEEEERLFP